MNALTAWKKVWKNDGRTAGTGPVATTPAKPAVGSPVTGTASSVEASDQPKEPVAPRRRVLLAYANPVRWQEAGTALRALHPDWVVVRASGVAEALNFLSANTVDAVVTEGNLPDGSGLELLRDAGPRQPKMLRFIEGEPQPHAPAAVAEGSPLHYLSPTPDGAGLEECLQRAFVMEEWLQDEGLRRVIPQVRKLPTLPALYTEIVSSLQSPEVLIETVAAYIANDIAMSARMLQLVNSSFFSLARRISSPTEAVLFLGLEKTKALILLAQICKEYERSACPKFSLDRLWQHSIAVATDAHTITQDQTGDAQQAGLAYTAGLLHDIGKLMLAANLPTPYTEVLTLAETEGVPLATAECRILGATHARIGACVLGAWGLPLSVLEAVAYHHEPRSSEARRFVPLTAVHVANVFDHIKHGGKEPRAEMNADLGHLTQVGALNSLNHWRQLTGCTRR